MPTVDYINASTNNPTAATSTAGLPVTLTSLIAGEDQTLNALGTVEAGSNYETVAASQTDQAMGATGATGDYFARLIITVATAATAATSIKDGAGSVIPILPNLPGGGIGVYVVELGMKSTAGAWRVTTGAGATAVGVGKFT